jgi:hypothetical protein
MRHDKRFHSRYDFVANFVEQIRSFANDDFVLAMQNSFRVLELAMQNLSRVLEHFVVAKIRFSFRKTRQVSAEFESFFVQHVLASHLNSSTNRSVFSVNHEYLFANFLAKLVIFRMKISHQMRNFVKLLAVVVISLLIVVISSAIVLIHFAIVMIVI